MASTLRKAGTAGAAALAIACAFIQPWEGLWTTAKIDTIGTGRPPTVCYGATRSEIPTLRVGDKFTKGECDALLLKSLPKYANEIAPCIKVAIPDKVYAALISGAYNAGSGAMCKSPMIAKINAGNTKAGCESFLVRDASGNPIGWYIRAQGRVVKGLVNRRTAERKLCLEGIGEPVSVPSVKPPVIVKPPEPKSVWAKLRGYFIRG